LRTGNTREKKKKKKDEKEMKNARGKVLYERGKRIRGEKYKRGKASKRW
jgi:hypothetical protein